MMAGGYGQLGEMNSSRSAWLRHQSQRGGGGRDARSPEGAGDSTSGGAVGTSASGRWATVGPAPSSPGAGEPSLALPALAGEAGEGVDSSTLAFFAARALKDRKVEEVEG